MRQEAWYSRKWVSTAMFIAVLAVFALATLPAFAQVTGSISGTVNDQTGAVVPKAKVTLTNQQTNDVRTTETNSVGYFSFAGVYQGTYTVGVEAEGFKAWKLPDFAMNAGDTRSVPDIALQIGSKSDTVNVEAVRSEVNVVDSGEKASVLVNKQIETLGLIGRDTSELLKTLPGVTVPANGTNNSSEFNYSDVSVAKSPIGHGMSVTGAPYRGGVATMYDGAFVTDPGDNSGNMATVNQAFTEEVKVQTANFGVDSPRGPIVINSTSKYGTTNFHGAAYLFARNNALNSNDWENNHNKTPKPEAKYYYPGGYISGPVKIPGTNLDKKLFFFGGFEYIWQYAPGVIPQLTSWIPSDSMLAGNFDPSRPDNAALCPSGLQTSGANWCRDFRTTTDPNSRDQFGNAINGYQVTVDPGAKAMMSFWPKANANSGSYNYYQPIMPQHNGWIYRTRLDYNLSDNDKFYGSWQQGKDSTFAFGNAHMWWVPGNSIPFPGNLYAVQQTKTLTGTFLHVFNNTLTNELVGSWAWANLPQTPGDLSKASRGTTGWNYATVFGGKEGANFMLPGYNSAGQKTFPDFSQDDGFTNTGNVYFLKKATVSFADHVTKVSRTHTFKFGANYDMLGNDQANLSSFQGRFSFGSITSAGQNSAVDGTHIGTANPLANFLMGVATGYNETNMQTINDQAYKTYGFYGMDTWKVVPRLTLNYGVRFDHYSRWYDRGDIGSAVFYPQRVVADFVAGKSYPGVYWHAIDSGVPLGGSPIRALFSSPRFGIAYDVFGTGKTVLRGGWGKYRWQDQWNDLAGPLSIPKGQLNYNLPGNTTIRTNQLNLLALDPKASWQPASVGLAASPTDYEMPVTTSFNFTISQQMPWKSLLEVAYVGNKTDNLLIGGQVGGTNIGGTNSLTNRNLVPIGAFFGNDPVTGVPTPGGNPNNIGQAGTNTAQWHYYPMGIGWAWVPDPANPGQKIAKQIYGTNAVNVTRHDGYGNYNGLQVAWTKQSEHLTFNLNYTFSKALTILNNAVNSFVVHDNYGVSFADRTHVINTSYSYAFGDVLHSSAVAKALANGWTVSGITSIQSGVNLATMANSENLGMNLNGYGSGNFYGTNAPMAVFPIITCDPRSNLKANQYINGDCLAAPPMSTNGNGYLQSGTQKLPYIHGPKYISSDLSLFKNFKVTEKQKIEFRMSAFNFLNHPLAGFRNSGSFTPRYTFNTATGTWSKAADYSSTFGYTDKKTGNRIVELGLKWSF